MTDLKHFSFRPGRITGAAILGLGTGLALTACSTSPVSSASSAAARPSASSSAATARPATSPAAPPASAAPVTNTPTTTGPAAAAPSATMVPMQTAAGGEFVSPTNKISCEVDYHNAGNTGAYCETSTPPESVKMGVTGTYTVCKGMMCQSNAAEGTPTLAYGTATGVGPFRCTSATTGITCLADGKGFHISTAGITAVSG